MKNIYTIYIICTIVLFLTGMPLIGMNIGLTIFDQQNDLDRVNRGLSDGIFQYYHGDKKIAEIVLFGSYNYANNKNLLHRIDSSRLEKVRSLICVTQHNRKNYTTALQFVHPDDTKDKENIYRHMAQQAYAQGNFALGQECYRNIFNLLNDSNQNKITKELYQVSKKCENDFVKNLLQLDPADTGTQCTLAGIYLSGQHNVSVSYDESLQYAEKAAISFVKIPIGTEAPIKYISSFPVTLKILCNDPTPQNIQNRAVILQNYFNIISAIKMANHARIQELGNQYKNNTSLQSAPLQLLCSNINASTIKLIANISFDDPEFITLCDSKNEIAFHALKWALHNLSLEPKIKDLCHIIIGGYEYHNNNFGAAIAHFEQCSNYKTDLYLQALSITANNSDNYQNYIASIIPPLQKATDSQSKNKKNDAAKKIIAEICGYDSSAPIEHILFTCQQLIPKLAVSTKDEKPLEYAHALLGLSDLCKNNSRLSHEQHKMTLILNTYFTFFSALQSDDQKKIDALFATKNSELSGLRRILFQAIRGNKKNSLQKIIFESEAFSEFCKSDPFLMEIIAYIITHPHKRFKIKPQQCHYILGGYALIQENYEAAREHFLQCDKTDLYIQAKLLETTPVKDLLEVFESCIPLLKVVTSRDHLSEKENNAKKVIANVINTIRKTYVAELLQNHEHEKTYKFTECLVQLNLPETYQALCNAFIEIEQCITRQPEKTYLDLLNIPSRINTYNAIKKLADQKNHNGCFCDCLSFILNEHRRHPSMNSFARMALERTCLEYLSCSLKHDVRTDDNSKQNKQLLYGNLAYYFGMVDTSISMLDKAIECGNARALYEKANILSQKKPANPNDFPTILALLEKHIISNDDDSQRALSYKALGKYYYAMKELEHKKKAFEYFKAAADLGNYDAGHLLALFYIDGIEGYQSPDKEKGFICLQNTIDLKKKDSYADALFIRASKYYIENQCKEAHEDLVHLLAFSEYNDSQKLFAYWLMGLVKLYLNENTDLSQDIVSYLRKAYEIGATHKLANPDSPFIGEFMLCNNENTLNNIQKNINHILENKKTDSASLDFCTVMGVVLLEQCATKPITNAHRQLAVAALLHATKNNHVEAPFSLLHTTEEEVGCGDKIYYLETLLQNNPDLDQIINFTLAQLYPVDVMHQGLLMGRFVEKNNPLVLKKYTSHLYENKKPIAIDPIFYSVFPHEKTEQIIKQCLDISFLVQAANAFIKNKIKSIPLEHFAAIFLGSLLTYSSDQQQLIKGAIYLETARTYFPTIQTEDVEKNLSYIYYKLGQQQLTSKNISLAIPYLKKSADLKNNNALLLLKTINQSSVHNYPNKKSAPIKNNNRR